MICAQPHIGQGGERHRYPVPSGAQRDAVAAAAKRLVELRNGWLAADTARTLTGLYNARPAWLDMAHADLDAAALSAYGLPHDAGRDQILAHLLALNLERVSDSADHRESQTRG